MLLMYREKKSADKRFSPQKTSECHVYSHCFWRPHMRLPLHWKVAYLNTENIWHHSRQHFVFPLPYFALALLSVIGTQTLFTYCHVMECCVCVCAVSCVAAKEESLLTECVWRNIGQLSFYHHAVKTYLIGCFFVCVFCKN